MYKMSGKEIKKLRLSLGMTQLEFALLIGTDPSLVSKWENEIIEPKGTTQFLLRLLKFLKNEGYTIQNLYSNN